MPTNTSRTWYLEAAEGGNGYAQYQLGCAYKFGDLGLLADEEKTPKWYRKAAKGGDDGAQRRLAEAYEEGDLGLLTDEEKA